MKIVFIRHGEPDYTGVTNRKFIGHGMDLAPLTEEGKKQAQMVSQADALNDAELIVSSPYTRALQTAAIISKNRNLNIEVELDLHEWLPDLSYTFSSDNLVIEAARLLRSNKGICPAASPIQYEELSAIFYRANAVLKKYLGYKKIAVVAHGMLIRQFAFSEVIAYCGISEIEYDDKFKWIGFVEK